MSLEDGRIVIHAVHKRDAEQLWTQLGLKETEKCIVCGKDVTPNNFSALAPWTEKQIVVVCESPSCFFKFNIMRRDRMIGCKH